MRLDASINDCLGIGPLPENGKRPDWLSHWLNLLPRLVVLGGIITSFLVIFGTGLFSIWGGPIRAFIGVPSHEELTQVRNDIREMRDDMEEMRRTVQIASRPDTIVYYDELPRQVAASCRPGQECKLSITVRRDSRAAECRLIAGQSELHIFVNGRSYVGFRSGRVPGRNAGTAPVVLEPTFEIPAAVPAGTHSTLLRTFYDGCFWQIDGEPPALQDSPRFALTIR